MNPIEHYGEEKKKLGKVREKAATEKQERLNIVEAYLKGQESSGVSREEILKSYFKKYKDFLDNRITEMMSPKERLTLLKELIYKHEILHEEESGMGVRKAA